LIDVELFFDTSLHFSTLLYTSLHVFPRCIPFSPLRPGTNNCCWSFVSSPAVI
jgi:hypothetical protein